MHGRSILRNIKGPKQTPDWLVEGATNLLPKKEETWIPKNYRPIACLSTTFKILTSVITDRPYSQNDIRIKRRKERLLWMQGWIDDQQCYLRKLQEEEEELVNSLDRLQESLWQCTPFLDTQMPLDVQDPPSNYSIHRRKHEPMEDHHDTSPQGRSSRDRTD